MLVVVKINLYIGANDPAVIWRFRNKDGSASELADDYQLTIKPLSSPNIVATTQAGDIEIDRQLGLVTYRPSAAVTSAISKGRGSYELMGTTDGLTRPWAGGPCEVERHL